MGERRPTWVYDAGQEPDPRYSLANERTFLAWVRTALALLAGAVALHSLGVPDPRWARVVLVLVLTLVGGAMTLLAYRRWARVEHAMRTGSPLPAFGLGLGLALGLAVVAVLLALALATA